MMTEEEEATKKKTTEEEKVKEKKEEEVVEERIYTIPLKHAWIAPIKKRTPRAVGILKSFMKRHMKAESLVISEEVNEYLWGRGIEGAPRKIRVRAARSKDDVVTVYLAKGG